MTNLKIVPHETLEESLAKLSEEIDDLIRERGLLIKALLGVRFALEFHRVRITMQDGVPLVQFIDSELTKAGVS